MSLSGASRPKAPIRVLTLTPFYPRKGDDAAGCFVAEPLPWLTHQSVESCVIAVQPVYRKKMLAPDSDVPAAWLRYFSLPGGFGLPTAGAFVFARIVGRVRELVRTRQVDLIHAHAPLPCGHAAMLLSSELGVPYVVSVHGLDAFSTTQVTGRAGAWCRQISRRVYSSSRRVICISEHVREQVLQGTGPGVRTSVVYNAVDPQRFAPPSADVKSDSQIVLSVGNLIPIKGHDVLLRAVAEISSEFPSLHLRIVGEGVERQRLEGLANQLGIAGRVSFLGHQSRSQVAAAMQRCAVFALPSRYEGLGCVYLEAMSSGKPVIGCRGQGISEIIRQAWNGFLVGPGNEKELALVLGMVLRDAAKRREIGRLARETILDRLTLEQQAESLARIYRESVA